MLNFLQVSGLTWPLPNAAVSVPGQMLARLMAAAERSEPGITALAASAVEEGGTVPASSDSTARISAVTAPLPRLAKRRVSTADRTRSHRRPRVKPPERLSDVRPE